MKHLRAMQSPADAVRRVAPFAAGTVLLLGTVSASQAQVIPSRSALNAQLVTSNTEDFEAYNIADGQAVANFVPGGFDSSTVFFGQGPGLVNSDLSFQGSADYYQWNGKSYYGQPSRDFLTNSQTLTINFLGSVNAFGVDLLSYSGYPATATVTVYDNAGNVVYSTSGLPVPDATDVNGYVIPTFFGYKSAVGIGKVDLTDEVYGWSPIVDNLTYGTAAVSDVPEPDVVAFGALAGGSLMGLVLRKRRA